MYIYLSNEETTPVEVYFDDFKVEQVKLPVVQANDYYPFGLTFNSYQRESSLINDWKFQGQENVDDLGLNWDSFKWRNYDPTLGRFFNVDPLSTKYVHNSTFAFAENKVITFKELEGLEGVHHMEGKTHVIEKNIVVLFASHLTAPSGATQKQLKKIGRKNREIDRANDAKLERVKSELNQHYQGSDGKDPQNSNGETVVFRFNFFTAPDISNKNAKTLAQKNAEYSSIARAYGIAGCMDSPAGTYNGNVPAAVVTNDGTPTGDPGHTTGATVMRFNYGAPSGTYAHEVMHTFGLGDNNYTSGGLRNSPPQNILKTEVDEILKSSYEKVY